MQPNTNTQYTLSTCNVGTAYRGPPGSRKISLTVAGIRRPAIRSALRPLFSITDGRTLAYNATEGDSRST